MIARRIAMLTFGHALMTLIRSGSTGVSRVLLVGLLLGVSW